MNQNIVRIQPRNSKHAAEQRGLVLAIAVVVAKDVARGMRLIASNPNLDGHVTNFGLQKGGQNVQLEIKISPASEQPLHLLRDLRVGVAAAGGQSCVPVS